MALWTDLAAWLGPTPNEGDGDGVSEPGDHMYEVRGMVIHIAEGYYWGTVSWQRNPEANVSSHFVVGDGARSQGNDGDIAQMVDTDMRAWTQGKGNGHWISIENAGFTPRALTAKQIESCAQLFARGHLVYGYPLQVTGDINGYGLGHHSMGCGLGWGHCDCPGDAIIAQKQQIVDRAIEIVGDAMGYMTNEDMQKALTEAGFSPGPADGMWGPRSHAALVAGFKSLGPKGDTGNDGQPGKDGQDGKSPKTVTWSTVGTVVNYADDV